MGARMRAREARFHFPNDVQRRWGPETTFSASSLSGAAHRGVTNVLGGCSRATIIVPGLAEPLRVMHLSDSHTDQGPDEASGSARLCEWMHNCYSTGFGRPGGQRQQIERRGYTIEATNALRDELEVAVQEKVDLILHTGDLINFPSPRAAAYAATLLRQTKRPFLYIGGNHDWQHAPVTLPDRSPAELRAGAETVLDPLFDHGARRQDFWVEDFKGIRFIGIDNSLGRFTEKQLEFFTIHGNAGDMPVVLMIHIPLFVPALLEEGRKDGINPLSAHLHLCAAPPCMACGPDAKTGPECDAHTLAFAGAVRSCPNLVAVLCGHIHDANSHALIEGTLSPVQYTADAGCYGASRVIDFVPPASKL